MPEVSLKQLLMRAGAPVSDAAIVEEIANHAAVQAIEVIDRVSLTVPDELRCIVMLTAARLTINALNEFLTEAVKTIEREL